MKTCRRCGGTGLVPDPKTDHATDTTCPECDGSGEVETEEEFE